MLRSWIIYCLSSGFPHHHTWMALLCRFSFTLFLSLWLVAWLNSTAGKTIFHVSFHTKLKRLFKLQQLIQSSSVSTLSHPLYSLATSLTSDILSQNSIVVFDSLDEIWISPTHICKVSINSLKGSCCCCWCCRLNCVRGLASGFTVKAFLLRKSRNKTEPSPKKKGKQKKWKKEKGCRAMRDTKVFNRIRFLDTKSNANREQRTINHKNFLIHLRCLNYEAINKLETLDADIGVHACNNLRIYWDVNGARLKWEREQGIVIILQQKPPNHC